MNSPSTFRRMLDGLLRSLSFAMVYLDDFLGFSARLEKLLEHIKKAISKLAGHRLKTQVSRCDSAKKQVVLLEHVASQYGVETNFEKTVVI